MIWGRLDCIIPKPAASKLIIATDLGAGHPTVDIMAAERRASCETGRIAGGNSPILRYPHAAGVAADEAAGPAKDWRRHDGRFGYGPSRNVGRKDGRRRDGKSSDSSKNDLLHGFSPLRSQVGRITPSEVKRSLSRIAPESCHRDATPKKALGREAGAFVPFARSLRCSLF